MEQQKNNQAKIRKLYDQSGSVDQVLRQILLEMQHTEREIAIHLNPKDESSK